jgi:hypothetical protein
MRRRPEGGGRGWFTFFEAPLNQFREISNCGPNVGWGGKLKCPGRLIRV